MLKTRVIHLKRHFKQYLFLIKNIPIRGVNKLFLKDKSLPLLHLVGAMYLPLKQYLCRFMLIYVKVKPNQRFDRVERMPDQINQMNQGWQIRLKAPAVDGKANEHLIEYLSEILGLPKSKIILKKGQTSKIKCLEISMEEQEVIAKLNQQSSV